VLPSACVANECRIGAPWALLGTTIAKILIADDSAVIRNLLRALLTGHPGWEVCGEAVDGWQATSMARQLKPDLVILDFAMPVLDGVHAAAEILGANPQTPIVLYTQYTGEKVALEARKVGVRAVVLKGENVNVLLKSIEDLLSEKSQASLPPDCSISTDAPRKTEPPPKKLIKRSGAP